MARKFNQELYAQARNSVLLYQKNRLHIEIQNEYKELLYESQKRKANKKTMKRLLKIYKTAMETHDWHHEQVMHIIRERLKEVIETGMYHPDEIMEYERRIITKKK